jgi:hypothetical protein
MKKNKRISITELVLLIMFSCIIMAMLSGCGPATKNITKTSTDQQVSEKKISDSLTRVITDMKARYESEKKESEYTGIKFQDCPPCAAVTIDSTCNSDSLVKIIRILESVIISKSNELSVAADGSIKASGQLKSYFVSKEKTEKKLLEVQHTNDSLRQVINQQDKQTKTTTVEKIVEKKRGWPWWIWIVAVIIFISGCVFWQKFGKRILSL